MTTFTSFYPGPSQLDEAVAGAMQEAAESGILSRNHRSAEFVALCAETVSLFREKLEVPANYQVFFVSSATECWEIIGQSFLEKVSFHIYNGAFGEKWFQHRQKLSANALGYRYPHHRMIGLNQLEWAQQAGVICLTQNETSNGSQVKNRMIRRLKIRFPDALIAVDATSSMGGTKLDWLYADMWFASVQKCFGLPAGLAVLVCSPKAIAQAKELGNNRHYNSLTNMAEQMLKFQTTHTPNVLSIFLLNRVLKSRQTITHVHRKLIERAEKMAFILQKSKYVLVVHHRRLRSATVLAVKAAPQEVKAIKEEAAAQGFLLGNGYGEWKENTFRIANFPAISDQAINALLDFLVTRKRQPQSVAN